MNPQDMTTSQRVAAIIAYLIQHKRATSGQLAAHFGVSQRTIFRNMRTIIDAGLPVLGISGDGYQWKPRPSEPDGGS